jgi:hypothetical protein
MNARRDSRENDAFFIDIRRDNVAAGLREVILAVRKRFDWSARSGT